MNFNISAFSHRGTERQENQDHILVNGSLLNDGDIHLSDQQDCFCFVADGVGGNNAGDFASHFVLSEIKAGQENILSDTENSLRKINADLIESTRNNNALTGCATTLSGLVIHGDVFKIIHTGDSQIWLMRNDMFFKISHDQVMDETAFNSPITSYFGGYDDYMDLDGDISLSEMLNNDIVLICSDGLLKSLNQKVIKSILAADKDIATKAGKILENCLRNGAEDNVSVILIHQINDLYVR
jgi:protein phosphatase